jgi:CHAT domain
MAFMTGPIRTIRFPHALSAHDSAGNSLRILVILILATLFLGSNTPAFPEARSAPAIGKDYSPGDSQTFLADRRRNTGKGYQWLFREGKEKVPEKIESAWLLKSFDRKVKQARKVYLSGDTAQATKEYRAALDHLAALIQEMPPGYVLLRELEKRIEIFDELATKILGPVSSEPREGVAEQVFRLMEERRVCRRNLTLKKAVITDYFDVPQSLLLREAGLLGDLLKLRIREGGAKTGKSKEALEAELERVRKALRAASPRLAILRRGLPLQLAEVRSRLLGDKEMILDFNLFRDRLVVGIISTEEARYYQYSISRSDVDKGVFLLQERLREFATGGQASFMGHAWKETSRRLYRLLLGKLPALPADKTTLFAIPDRSLWYLPLSVLLDGDDRPFGRNRVVSLIPSAGMLKFQRSPFQSDIRSRRDVNLLLFESIPWISEEDIAEAGRKKSRRGRRGREISEGERIERLILTNPVYPRPSSVVVKIQKMFTKSEVWVGATATLKQWTEQREAGRIATVLAVPLAVTDRVRDERQPCFFFSPDSRGRRRFEVRSLFSVPLGSPLVVLPAAWYGLPEDRQSVGEGPLLLSTALIYSGVQAVLVNYSDPDWGEKAPFLSVILKKTAEGVAPGRAIRDYPRELPVGLDSSFSGRPPGWAGWVLTGDPGR